MDRRRPRNLPEWVRLNFRRRRGDLRSRFGYWHIATWLVAVATAVAIVIVLSPGQP